MLDAERALAAASARAGIVPRRRPPRSPPRARPAGSTPATGPPGPGGRQPGGPAGPRPHRTGRRGRRSGGRPLGASRRHQPGHHGHGRLPGRLPGLGPILDDLDGAADACARLAEAHRVTVMAGRTLGQQALPTTFGLKAAGWLVALDDAADGMGGSGGSGWPPSSAGPPGPWPRSGPTGPRWPGLRRGAGPARACPGTPTGPGWPSWPEPRGRRRVRLWARPGRDPARPDRAG